MKIVVTLAALALTLTGCAGTAGMVSEKASAVTESVSNDPVDVQQIALDTIRKDAPIFASASDAELIELMRLTCDVVELGGAEALMDTMMEYDLDPSAMGTVSAGAMVSECPELADEFASIGN